MEHNTVRVLQVSPGVPPEGRGGQERFAYELSILLARRNHSVILMAGTDGKSGSRSSSERMKVSLHRNLFHMGGVPVALHFKDMIFHKDYDLLHMHLPTATSFIDAFVSKLLKIPLVISYHSEVQGSGLFERLLGKAYILIEKLAIANSNAVTVPSKYYARKLLKHIPPDKVWVLSPGVDETFRCACSCKHQHKYRILFVGSLEKRKGLDLLFSAFPKVARAFPSVELALVGSGRYKEFLRAKSYDEGVGSRILFLDHVSSRSKLAEIYRCSMLLVLPSRYETFGMVLIEAMASKIPVLATGVGGIPEIVIENFNGLLADNEVDFSRKMIALLGDRCMARHLGRRGGLTVRKFTWEKAATQAERIYKSVLAAEYPDSGISGIQKTEA